MDKHDKIFSVLCDVIKVYDDNDLAYNSKLNIERDHRVTDTWYKTNQYKIKTENMGQEKCRCT